MDFWDINGSNYAPRIENIKLPKIEKLQDALGAIAGAGKLAGFEGVEMPGLNMENDLLSRGENFFEEHVILH